MKNFPQSRQLFDLRIGLALANPLRLRVIGRIGMPYIDMENLLKLSVWSELGLIYERVQ